MKNTAFPFRLFIFWMLCFTLFRVLFIFSILFFKPEAEYDEAIKIFFYGLRLDASVTAYLSAIPVLIWIISIFMNKSGLLKVAKIFTMVFIVPVVIIQLSNIMLYRSWGTLINSRALAFALQPVEMFASLTTLQIIIAFIVIILLSAVLIFSANRFLKDDLKNYKFFRKIILSIAVLFLLPVMIRGGLQQIPVNESAAVFSIHPHLNHAATNPVWYLANSIKRSGLKNKNPYVFMDQSKANNLTDSLIVKSGNITQVIKSSRPNIVLIMLESWTADIIEPLDGEKGLTPFFTSLCDSGLLFTQVYSSGRRTDQMFPSVISGFPAQPDQSLVKFSDKIAKLPMLTLDLKSENYHTSFFYGGELGFANMNTFLRQAGFEYISGIDDYPSETKGNKWGAHDEYVLQNQFRFLSGIKQPFFSMVLTLDTHEPFDVPFSKFKGNDDSDKFRNAAAYTDHCLARFFNNASTQPWFKNTLFILVADHGHLLPLKRNFNDSRVYHIPLLFYGNVIHDGFRGKQITNIASQHDLPSTLLSQLGMNVQRYSFSNNILDSSRNNFAYFNLDEGFGWISPGKEYIYNFSSGQDSKSATDSTVNPEIGKAYLQYLYYTFLEL